MRLYTVHLSRSGDNNMDQVKDMALVKEGFCWPAFYLSFIWALSRRMWVVAIGFAVVMLVADSVATILGLGPIVRATILLGLGVIIGFAANDLRRWTLETHGWTFEGVVVAADLLAAERRFLENEPRITAEFLK